jgi:hypothetical protein
VLGAEEVQRYRSALEAFERDNGGPLRGPMMFKTHLLFRWVDELIRHPKVLDAVEDILGPNLLAWNTHFFIKEPGDERYVAWHQDLTYWNLDPGEALTAWIALSPSTPKSGAMLTRGQEIAVEVDEDKAIDVTLRPGEMSLHHQKIFHASPANRADDRRIGLAIRYIPTHVRQVVIDDDSAALVRGTDEYGHFQLEPRPERDMDPALVAMQAEAAERQARILYHGTDRPTFRADI